MALIALLAGLLLPGPGRTGHGQTAAQAGRRAVDPLAVAAVDAGFDPLVRSSAREMSLARSGVSAAANPRYVSGEVIVKFAGSADFDLLEIDPGADPEAAARALAARPDVEYAQPAYLRQPLFVPDDPYFAEQWNLAVLNMTQAWDINRGAGDTVIAAVIDTGVAFFDGYIEYDAGPFTIDDVLEYPALGALRIPFAAAPDLAGPGRFVAPWDFVWGDEFPVDLHGHGTHVAGTVGQLTDNGVGAASMAFNVRIMPLKVVAGEWDLIFGAIDECCGGSDADVARRPALRRRKRRARDQPQPRRRGRVSGDRRRRPGCRGAGRVRGHCGGQRVHGRQRPLPPRGVGRRRRRRHGRGRGRPGAAPGGVLQHGRTTWRSPRPAATSPATARTTAGACCSRPSTAGRA